MSQLQLDKAGKSLSLFDLIDRIMDKGLVVDAFVSVSLVGTELLVIRARLVVSSVETFLRYCSAMGLYGEPGGVLNKEPARKEIKVENK